MVTPRRTWQAAAIAGMSLLAAAFIALHMIFIPSVKGELAAQFAASDTRMLDWTRVARLVAPVLLGPGLAILAILIGLGVVEWNGRGVSLLLQRVDRPGGRPLLLATAVAAVTGAIYLAPGAMTLGDAGTHLYRAEYFLQEIRLGRLPIWAFQWYMGYPFGQFYSQGANATLAAIAALFGNVMFSAKLLSFVCHLAGGIGVFLFLRTWTGRALPALLALFAYAILRQNIKVVMLDGRITGALFLAIVPYTFLFAYKIMESPGWRWPVALGSALGLLVHTHYGLLPPLAPIWLLYLIVLLYHFSGRGGWKPGAWIRLAAAHVGALGLGLSLILPVLIEGGWVNMPRLVASPQAPPLREWASFIEWSPLGQTYQGMIFPGVALLGLLLARGGDRALAAAFLGGACLDFWFWGPQNRVLSFFALGLTVPAGLGIQRILSRFPAAAGRTAVFLLLLILMDQGAFALMNTYATDVNLRSREWETIRDLCRATPPAGGRVAEGPLVDGRMSFSAWRYYPLPTIPTVVGPFIQGSTPSFRYTNAILMTTALSINGKGEVDRPSAEGLALLNVGLILAGDRFGYTEVPAAENAYAEKLREMPGLRLRYTYPVLFARRFSAVPDSIARFWTGSPGLILRPGLDPRRYVRNDFVCGLIEAMEVDLARAVAQRCFRPYGDDGRSEEPPPAEARVGALPGESPDRLEILRHDWDGQRVDLTLRVPDRGYLRFAYAFYPTLTCRVDGRVVAARPDALGAMVVPIDPGEHRISLRPSLSGTRKLANGISIVFVVIAGILLLPERSRAGRS